MYCNHHQAVILSLRILMDWVRSQIAILETEMVNAEQIFLPYMIIQEGQTLFDKFEEQGLYLTTGKD